MRTYTTNWKTCSTTTCRTIEPVKLPHHSDPLGPAKGCLLALVLGLAVWAAIIAILFAIF